MKCTFCQDSKKVVWNEQALGMVPAFLKPQERSAALPHLVEVACPLCPAPPKPVDNLQPTC